MKKNNKGFISISIIYSFFIIFLLLLTLIMTTYINNRYSFNIFSKDEKRAHASKTTVTPNLTSSISYTDSKVNYFSYYYYRTRDIEITNDDGSKTPSTENYDYTNFYYYSNSASKVTNLNTTFNFIIILGPYKDHSLNYNSFFGDATTPSYAYKGIENSTSRNNRIIIAPSLNSEYVTWTEALKDEEGRKDLNTRLINAIGSQIINTSSTDDFLTQCQSKSSCKINITFIGYQDGANGLLKYMGNVDDTSVIKQKYFLIDSSTICNTAKCDELTTAELSKISSRLEASSGSMARFFASGVSATNESEKYYTKMYNIYYKARTTYPDQYSLGTGTLSTIPQYGKITSYTYTDDNVYKLIGSLINLSV